mgnify:CR=1 FL=1
MNFILDFLFCCLQDLLSLFVPVDKAKLGQDSLVIRTD